MTLYVVKAHLATLTITTNTTTISSISQHYVSNIIVSPVNTPAESCRDVVRRRSSHVTNLLSLDSSRLDVFFYYIFFFLSFSVLLSLGGKVGVKITIVCVCLIYTRLAVS